MYPVSNTDRLSKLTTLSLEHFKPSVQLLCLVIVFGYPRLTMCLMKLWPTPLCSSAAGVQNVHCGKLMLLDIPYIWKYWRSLNLAIWARSGCNLILAEIIFGGCTARTKYSR